MCIMYVEGTKIEDPIIIGNNVNQQIIFTDNFKVFNFYILFLILKSI